MGQERRCSALDLTVLSEEANHREEDVLLLPFVGQSLIEEGHESVCTVGYLVFLSFLFGHFRKYRYLVR